MDTSKRYAKDIEPELLSTLLITPQMMPVVWEILQDGAIAFFTTDHQPIYQAWVD